MGNYFDKDFSKMKAHTKFEVKVDYAAILLKAYENIDSQMWDFVDCQDSDEKTTLHEKIKQHYLDYFIDQTGHTLFDETIQKYYELGEFVDGKIDEELSMLEIQSENEEYLEKLDKMK